MRAISIATERSLKYNYTCLLFGDALSHSGIAVLRPPWLVRDWSTSYCAFQVVINSEAFDTIIH